MRYITTSSFNRNAAQTVPRRWRLQDERPGAAVHLDRAAGCVRLSLAGTSEGSPEGAASGAGRVWELSLGEADAARLADALKAASEWACTYGWPLGFAEVRVWGDRRGAAGVWVGDSVNVSGHQDRRVTVTMERAAAGVGRRHWRLTCDPETAALLARELRAARGEGA